MSVLAWTFVASVAWLMQAQSLVVATDDGVRHPLATTQTPKFSHRDASLTNNDFYHDNEDLVDWSANVATSIDPPSYAIYTNDSPVFLVIGVKTSVLHHFSQRQAIRETWASATALQNTTARVVFLGCEPDFSSYTDPVKQASVAAAIAAEQRTYQDLLTSELGGCVDSYKQLLHKVVSFMHWVVTTAYPIQQSLRYVMVVDDDVYLRVDRLVEMLRRDATPTTRFYSGRVFKAHKPMRRPAHKNYISEEEYALWTLPPFVSGPHYVVSMDIVHYVTRNRLHLRGLRGLDDVSIALWLLALQIHPIHLSQFVLLRSTPCHDQALALADLSPSALYLLHRNAAANHSFCDGVHGASARGRHRSIVLPDAQDRGTSKGNISMDTFLTWELVHDPVSYALHVSVTIAVASRAIHYDFVPATTPYDHGLCMPATRLLQTELYIFVENEFCEYHREQLRDFMDKVVHDDHRFRAMLTLPRHNIAVTSRLTVTVGLSRGAKYARVLIENLLLQMYSMMRILVLSEDAFVDSVPPDIFVFSILDDDAADGMPDGARYITKYGHRSRLVMLAGEAWVPEKLDPRVTLITTRTDRIHRKQLYLPVASTMFAESIQHTPLELLQPYAEPDPGIISRRFCAYLYARCDRLRREYMFDLLNAIEAVDALGACQGATHNPLPLRATERFTEAFYTDAAIAKYTNYRFVVAFENTVAPGYVTEKIVTAFLAGAIPIYYGHSPTVVLLFNRDALINCGDFESLRACAQHVRTIHESPAKYEAMKAATPVVNRTLFLETFGWHPEVATAQGEETPMRLITRLKVLLETEIVGAAA